MDYPMPTLILSPRHTDASQILWRAAIAQGWDVERFPSFRIPEDFDPPDPVIYGEPLFNKLVADHLNVTLDEPAEDFLLKMPYQWTKRIIEYISAGDARLRQDGPLFIKPPHNKTFKAGVFESGAGIPPEIGDDEMVLLQEVVKWGSEYRFFISGGVPVCHSVYMYKGEYAKTPEGWTEDTDETVEVMDFIVNRIMQTMLYHNPPHAYVLDVGVIEGRGPAIVEFNEICGSGIYGCPPVPVLQALKGAVHANH
jgi:hypothetical protein